jgi:hypothetical protein
MRTIFVVISASVVAIGLLAVRLSVLAGYAQASCEVGNDSAVIWVDDLSRIRRHEALLYNVEFSRSGITVRLPPEYYAPDWTQVDSIEMKYRDRASPSGILQLHLHNTDGSAFVETVGNVKRSCWNSIKAFIRRHIETHGTAVRMIDTPSN